MHTVKNAPERIYLQVSSDDEDFNSFSEVTWSKHRISERDLEYSLLTQQAVVESEDSKVAQERYNSNDIDANELYKATDIDYQQMLWVIQQKQEAFINGCQHKSTQFQSIISNASYLTNLQKQQLLNDLTK